jgi:hypothetical protein
VSRTIVPLPTNPRVAGGPPVDSGDSRTRAAAVNAAADADLPDGLHTVTDGAALFKAGDAYLRVRFDDDGGARHAMGTFGLPEIEWEHGYLSQAVRRLVAQTDYARELNVTAEQMRRLEKLPEAPPSKWPKTDRDRFVAMSDAWEKAQGDDKARAAAALLEALKAYAGPKRAADHKAMADRVKQIREILTPEQLAKVNPIKPWNFKQP